MTDFSSSYTTTFMEDNKEVITKTSLPCLSTTVGGCPMYRRIEIIRVTSLADPEVTSHGWCTMKQERKEI